MSIDVSGWRKKEQARSDAFMKALLDGDKDVLLKGSPLSADDLIRWHKQNETLKHT